MMEPAKPKKSAAHAACTCGSLRKASRRISQFYDTALAPAGIKSTQFSILSEVERGSIAGPVTMCELASAMVMDRSTLGHNLRPLERDDLVVLRQARHDRRQALRRTDCQGQVFAAAGAAALAPRGGPVREDFRQRSRGGIAGGPLGYSHNRDLDSQPLR